MTGRGTGGLIGTDWKGRGWERRVENIEKFVDFSLKFNYELKVLVSLKYDNQ